MSDEEQKKPSRYEIWKDFALPGAIALSSLIVSATISCLDIQQRTWELENQRAQDRLQIAIGILGRQADSETALRRWAVEHADKVMNLSEEEKEALLTGEALIGPTDWSMGSFEDEAP